MSFNTTRHRATSGGQRYDAAQASPGSQSNGPDKQELPLSTSTHTPRTITLWQAAGVTALFVAACGSYGYATRRDLSSWARTLFWALIALIGFGIVTIFISIPNGNIIYAVLGLGIFGGYTIFDFNRLLRSNPDAAVPIAAGIFLDIFNIFLLALNLFGGER